MHNPAQSASRLLLLACLAVLAPVAVVGCIQDNVVIPVAFLVGKVVPVGIVPTTTTTTTTSVMITLNTTVPTVGIRLDTVGSGTDVSLINPIGPGPGSPESTFATTTGDYILPTKRLGHR